MSGNNDTKTQHFVPRTYLKRFTSTENDKLFAVNLKTGNEFTPGLSKVAAVNWFYEVGDLEVNAVENLLSRWESNIPDSINAVESAVEAQRRCILPSSELLQPADKLSVLWLVLVQLFRTPAFRERWRSFVREEEIGDLDADEMHSASLAKPSTYERYVELWGDFYLSTLIAPPGEYFWTSDNPVAVSFGNGMGNGLGTGHPWVHFPLTRKLLLELHDPESISGIPKSVVEVSSGTVEWYNHLQIASAFRQVYSPVPIGDDVRAVLQAQPAIADRPHQLERRGTEMVNPEFKIVPPK